MLPRKEGQLEPYALEDMISDLQARRNSLDRDDDVGDPHELLKQRERDLVLAAELGKALLERNQELTRQGEALTEEYANKLEVSFFFFFTYKYFNINLMIYFLKFFNPKIRNYNYIDKKEINIALNYF